MRPIRTVGAADTFRGWHPSIADLPGKIDKEDQTFTSVFRLSDEERATVAAGGQVELVIFGLPIPPVALNIVNLEEAADVGDHTCENCAALYVQDRAEELELTCGQCGGRLGLPETV